MSGDFIERAEFQKALREHDTEIREHYDEICGAAMIKLAETERDIGEKLNSMGEKLAKNIKWLVVLLATSALAYGSIAVAREVAARAEKITSDAAQEVIDTEQNRQQLATWRAIEKAAAIVGEHRESTRREFDQHNDAMKEIRRETRERVQQLEAVQREHERGEH